MPRSGRYGRLQLRTPSSTKFRTAARRKQRAHCSATTPAPSFATTTALTNRSANAAVASSSRTAARVRRKFIEAEGGAPKECAEAIALIGELNGIERRASTVPPEEPCCFPINSRSPVGPTPTWASRRWTARCYDPPSVGLATSIWARCHKEPKAGPPEGGPLS